MARWNKIGKVVGAFAVMGLIVPAYAISDSLVGTLLTAWVIFCLVIIIAIPGE